MKDARTVPRSFSATPAAGALDDAQRTQVQRALVFIEENLGNALGVAEIARVACYAPRHFQRLFHQFTGESVHDHIRRLRVERAAVLLRFTRMTVTDAALLVGFSNPSGLYKACQQRFGCAPADFAASAVVSAAASVVPAMRSEWLPALRVGCIRHIGDPKDALRTWMQLLAWARAHSLLTPDARLVGLNYDSRFTPPAAQRYDAGITLPPSFTPGVGSGIVVRELPAGPVLMQDFRGTLTALEARWEFLTEHWFPTSGRRLRGSVCFDLYPASEATLPRLLALLANPRATLRATLCVPVESHGARSVERASLWHAERSTAGAARPS